MTAKAPPRRASRALAFQVLYGQEFVNCASVEDLEQAFLAAPRADQARQDQDQEQDEASGFAWELVSGVWEKSVELDKIISDFARNWRIERVGRVELTLLRLAVYEILYRPDVPAKVAMNEALDLNKQFGEEKSRAFINGILDSVCKASESGKL